MSLGAESIAVSLAPLTTDGGWHGVGSRQHALHGCERPGRGDAHALNFGSYASSERRLGFDLNDFDEPLPGSWKSDLKGLVVTIQRGGVPAEPGI
jgi:hypothetical protein